MIDLTPLEVRKKKGDFRRIVRGYDPAAVDGFIDIVADRCEQLVRENATIKERLAALSEANDAFQERERALNDALVSAQQLREEIKSQSARDAELVLREARLEAERIVEGARHQAQIEAAAARRIHAQRTTFLRSFRAQIERQLEGVEQEEERLRLTASTNDVLRPERSELHEESVTAMWISSLDAEGPGREG